MYWEYKKKGRPIIISLPKAVHSEIPKCPVPAISLQAS